MYDTFFRSCENYFLFPVISQIFTCRVGREIFYFTKILCIEIIRKISPSSLHKAENCHKIWRVGYILVGQVGRQDIIFTWPNYNQWLHIQNICNIIFQLLKVHSMNEYQFKQGPQIYNYMFHSTGLSTAQDARGQHCMEIDLRETNQPKQSIFTWQTCLELDYQKVRM